MCTNLETRTVDNRRDKVTEGFGQVNNGTSEQLDLTSRGIEILHLLNDAFDSDHSVRQLAPAAHPLNL